jgi:uncharacterized membrane protein
MVESWIRAFYQFLDKMGFSHPIHVVLVHLPIGFVVGAFILGSIAILFGRDKLALSARHCIILAIFFWFPVVLFGFTDWVHYYGRVWLPAIKIKMILTGILFILLLAVLYFESSKKTSKWVILTLYTFCLITVVPIGWYGAQLIYGTNPQLTLMPYKSGYQVFINECKNCHPDGGNTMDAQKPINNSPKLRDINIFISFVRHPEGIMPPFPASTISDHETEELYLYITTEMNK